MSVKLFFQTHGRFPTTDEFRLIRTFKLYQPYLLREDIPSDILADHPVLGFLKHARRGDVEQLRENLSDVIANSEGGTIRCNETNVRLPTMLCAAAQGDQIDVLALLLDNGVPVDARPPHNRTALLFASESGHFNSMNYLISRGATYFTYSDQQIESYFMSYTIRQSITRRELSYILPGDLLPGIVLDYLGLGGHRTRPIERLAPVNMHNKTSFGAKPIPETIITPIPIPHPCSVDLTNRPIEAYTPSEWAEITQKMMDAKQNQQSQKTQQQEAFIQSVFPQGFTKND